MVDEHKQAEDYLRKLAVEHVWVPLRPWKTLIAPRGFNIFTEGKGCRVTDISGKTYLDFFASIMCNAVGYGRKEIADAVYEQMKALPFPPTHELTIPKIKLAKKLADITPGSLSKVFFASSGTESIETALMVAKKYQRLLGFGNKFKIIGGYTYHGSTVGAKSTGWRQPDFTWEDFEPLMPGVVHVSSPHCSVCDFGLTYPSCDLQCARQIDKVIQLEGPDTVAAFLDVPIATAGYVPPPEYWPMVRSICDKYGLLLILDEIVTGFGRTGKWFGTEHYGIVPDIMVIGKAVTSGYIPLSAAIVTKEVAQKFEGGPKEVLRHSYTFEGHPVPCAVALANIEIIERENLVESARVMGEYLFERLQVINKHKMVGEIRGIGLLCDFDLVKDKKTSEPLSPEENTRVRSLLKTKCTEAGLWGAFRNPVPVIPSLIVTKSEIDEIVTIFDRVLGEIEMELSL